MDQCASCGAALAPGAQWCGQCYAVPGSAPVTQTTPFSQTVPSGQSQFVGASTPAPGSIMSPARMTDKKAFVPLVARTRWRKTPTTFGPLGRVLCTLGLVLPFIFLTVVGIFTGGLEIGGAVIWGFVVMPLGLRDVWKAGTIPLN